jgi:hypothetical protein
MLLTRVEALNSREAIQRPSHCPTYKDGDQPLGSAAGEKPPALPSMVILSYSMVSWWGAFRLFDYLVIPW